MVENVAENIFRIVVPLPIPTVGSMNSYVITDEARNLIVDPGMDHPLCFDAMREAVEELGLDLGRTDFFITHHHLDHFGLVSRLMTDGSAIFISRAEADFIARIASWAVLADVAHFLEVMGFPETDPMKVVSVLLGDEYRARASWPFRYVAEGDLIEKGGCRFRCLVTPGHSIAHTCLYEPDRKILITGDEISPVVQFVSWEMNPLADHLQSLDRLRRMNVDLVLPGHGSVFRDHKKRIDQLKVHYGERSEACHAALADGGKDAYEVAVYLQQMLNLDPWDSLHQVQKFFFTRHALAHLRSLEAEGRVRKERWRRRIRYFQN
jgi:glyoxylase-like metal-dependent hydrolase (beta-lactamase superfamily II)